MRIAPNKMAALSIAAAVLVTTPVLAGNSDGQVKVTRPGTFVAKAETDHFVAAVGYRLAATSPRSDWLIIELAASARGGETATFRREDFQVVAPDGTVIPLADQRTFGASYTELRPYLRRMMVTRDPLGYFPPLRRYCDIQFFTEPGRKIVFDQVQVDHLRVCDGMLAFQLPKGFAAGTWTLVIQQPEGAIHMPLILGNAKAE